jgi:beta-galactosidase
MCNKVFNLGQMRHILFLLLFLLIHLDAVSQKKSSSVTSEDPYLTKLYWKLNDSPMQQKLRRLKPFPVSVVYYQQTDHNLDSIRKTFQTIRELGFTSLKQIELKGPLSSDSFEQVVFNTALDEDLYPWYYGMGGWKDITPQLVKERRLKIDYSSGNMRAIQNDPAIIRWQKEYLRKRIERMKSAPKKPAEMGEPGRNYPFITSRLIPSFAKWLENQYGTIDKLKQAWGNGHTRNVDFESFSEAAQALELRV